MQTQVFNAMLAEIFATFGRAMPVPDSPAYRSLWRRVCEEKRIPDDAARDIAYAIAGYDALPMNLGKAILAEYDLWLGKRPQMHASQAKCPECDAELPGAFWAWRDDGVRVLMRCACRPHTDAWTRRQAIAAGYLLHDPAFPLVDEAGEGAWTPGAHAGRTERIRRAHSEALEAAGW